MAINVCLYSRKKNYWAMREQGANAAYRDHQHFQVAASYLHHEGNTVTVHVNERGSLPPTTLKGTITLKTDQAFDTVYDLDAAGHHKWRPIAPIAHVDVRFDKPGISFSGRGYLDSNWGNEPLKNGFRTWDWSRTTHGGDTVVLYDMRRRDGSDKALGLRFSPDGSVSTFDPPERVQLKRGFWGMNRSTQTDNAQPPTIIATLEDGPFYMRSHLETPLFGERLTTMHESVDLDKHQSPLTLMMLPWRMPRGPVVGLGGQLLGCFLQLRRLFSR